MRKTKIIATLGPATASYGKIVSLIKAGVNVFRLNFSHGDFKFFSGLIGAIKKARSMLGAPVAILQDLQGPKIRVAGLLSAVNVKRGDKVIIRNPESGVRSQGAEVQSRESGIRSQRQSIQIDFKNLYRYVKAGQRILINDGMVQLRIEKIKGAEIICNVTAGGEIAPRKGVNLPHARLPVASLTEKDRKNLRFGLKNKVDIVCLSFVRDAKDMKALNSLIRSKKDRPLVIAKIEKPEALKQINAILDESDGIMVARGDLAVEAGYRAIPGAQKMLVAKANAKGKLVIVATQMLESMISNPYPERAEITDVYNAVLDGADAVMLSGETSVGKYPEKTVRVMSGILKEAEKEHKYAGCGVKCAAEEHRLENALSRAAAMTAEALDGSVIAVRVEKEKDIRYISDNRPKSRVIAVVESGAMQRKMAIYHGVNPVFSAGGAEQAVKIIKRTSKGIMHIVYVDFRKRGITVY